MTINPNGHEIEFPTPICPITEPHAKHIIPGTWREQCNGVTPEQHSSDYWERTTEGMPRVPAFQPPRRDETRIMRLPDSLRAEFAEAHRRQTEARDAERDRARLVHPFVD